MAALTFKIGANTSALSAGIKRSRAMLGGLAKSAARVGGAMALAGVVAGVAFGKSAVNSFEKFESAMLAVKAVSKSTGAEFAALKANARQLGASTRFTSAQVAGLQLSYSKLGFASGEITKVTEGTLALAQATGSDLARSAEVAGGTLRGFNLDVSETGRVTDVMAASFSSSALDMEKFAESMKLVAPIANQAGVSIEETSALLSVLADASLSGSMAGTALRRILNELAATGKPFGEALADLTAKGLTLADANDEVGRRAQVALLILAKNGDKLAKLKSAYEGSAGAAKEMADVMDSGLGGSMARLGSAWDELKISLGESLAPLAHGLIDGMQIALKTVKILGAAFSEGSLPALLGDGLMIAAKGMVNFLVKHLKGMVAMGIAGVMGMIEVWKAGFSMITKPSFWLGLASYASGLGLKMGAALMSVIPQELLDVLGAGGIGQGLNKRSSDMFGMGNEMMDAAGGDKYVNALADTVKGMGKAYMTELAGANVLDSSAETNRINATVDRLARGLDAAGKKQAQTFDAVKKKQEIPPVVKAKPGILDGKLSNIVSSMAKVGGGMLGGVVAPLDKERNQLLKAVVRNTSGGTVARYA